MQISNSTKRLLFKILVSFLISTVLSFISLFLFPPNNSDVYAQSNCYCKKIYCDNTELPKDPKKCNAPPATIPPCRCEHGLYIVICPENSFYEDCVRQEGCGGGEFSCDISDCDTPSPCDRKYANCYFGCTYYLEKRNGNCPTNGSYCDDLCSYEKKGIIKL